MHCFVNTIGLSRADIKFYIVYYTYNVYNTKKNSLRRFNCFLSALLLTEYNNWYAYEAYENIFVLLSVSDHAGRVFWSALAFLFNLFMMYKYAVIMWKCKQIQSDHLESHIWKSEKYIPLVSHENLYKCAYRFPFLECLTIITVIPNGATDHASVGCTAQCKCT